MKKRVLIQLVGASVLATLGLAAQAAGPDWSLIISGPSIVIPPAPAQVAPVRVAPPAAVPAQVAPVQGGFRPDMGNFERDRDHYFQERYQDRENYYLERERAFLARERAFLEREKQRQLVVDNNQRAAQVINDRQDAQLDRIVEGVNTNRITKDQFTTLMTQQKNIRNQERSFSADGFLSREEYQQLTLALDAADQTIRQNLRDRYPQPRERIYYPQAR